MANGYQEVYHVRFIFCLFTPYQLFSTLRTITNEITSMDWHKKQYQLLYKHENDNFIALNLATVWDLEDATSCSKLAGLLKLLEV
jgi:hypothetical protein